MNKQYELLLNRRSIRKYTDQKVDEETIKKILEAGLSAPSAKNLQPWHFIVVTDREALDKLADVRPVWKMLKGAPLGFVVLADLSLYDDVPAMYVQDCSAATENMLLAAQALGLGGVWLGLYPREEAISGVRELFDIPENMMPIAAMSIGYPAEQRDPRPEPKWEKVHWQKF